MNYNKIKLSCFASSALILKQTYSQVDTMKQYFPVFDRLRKEFLAGEMIWTLTDYNVLECKWKGWLKRPSKPY